jgi:hypothetical protein
VLFRSSNFEDDSRNRSAHLPNIPKSPAPSALNSGKQTESSSDDDESGSEIFSEIELDAIKAADAKIEKDRIAAIQETQRLEDNAREAKIAADAVAKYKESLILEQKAAEDEETIIRQTIIDNAKKAQEARAEQEALNNRASDFYFQSGQNPLAPIGNSPVIDRIPKYPSALAKDPFWSQTGLDPSLAPPQYTPLNGNSMFNTHHPSTDNFLQYRPSRSLNYSEDSFVQPGLPKDGTTRITEQYYLGSGHFPAQEREPSVQFPLPVPPVFLNHTGRIAIGTPEVTKAILARSAAVQKLVASTNYVPDNTIAWLVHSDNFQGHQNRFAPLPQLTDSA